MAINPLRPRINLVKTSLKPRTNLVKVRAYLHPTFYTLHFTP